MDCPQKYDIQTLSIEEIKMELMVKRDMVKVEEPPVAIVESDSEDFVQDNE